MRNTDWCVILLFFILMNQCGINGKLDDMNRMYKNVNYPNTESREK